MDINYINIEGIPANTCLESMDSSLGPESSKAILPAEASAGTHPPSKDTEVTSHTEASAGTHPPSKSTEVTSHTEAQAPFVSSSSYASNLNLSFGLQGFEKEQSRLKKRR